MRGENGVADLEERYCAARDCGAMFLVTKSGLALGDRGGRADRGHPEVLLGPVLLAGGQAAQAGEGGDAVTEDERELAERLRFERHETTDVALWPHVRNIVFGTPAIRRPVPRPPGRDWRSMRVTHAFRATRFAVRLCACHGGRQP
jgi:hypothetical protein